MYMKRFYDDNDQLTPEAKAFRKHFISYFRLVLAEQVFAGYAPSDVGKLLHESVAYCEQSLRNDFHDFNKESTNC